MSWKIQYDYRYCWNLAGECEFNWQYFERLKEGNFEIEITFRDILEPIYGSECSYKRNILGTN